MFVSVEECFWSDYHRDKASLLDQLAALDSALNSGKRLIFSKEDWGHDDLTAECKRQVERALAELEALADSRDSQRIEA